MVIFKKTTYRYEDGEKFIVLTFKNDELDSKTATSRWRDTINRSPSEACRRPNALGDLCRHRRCAQLCRCAFGDFFHDFIAVFQQETLFAFAELARL